MTVVAAMTMALEIRVALRHDHGRPGTERMIATVAMAERLAVVLLRGSNSSLLHRLRVVKQDMGMEVIQDLATIRATAHLRPQLLQDSARSCISMA
jgi:hypothetical protein